MARMRSASKNMCSVRQRPMPSAPNERAWRASRGVSALARTLRRRIPSAQPMSVAKCPDKFRLTHRRGALQDETAAAVDGDHVAFAEEFAGNAHLSGFIVDLERAGARHARQPHAARDDGGVRGHAAARRQNAGGRKHAVDVFRARLDAHEDDAAALAPSYARPRRDRTRSRRRPRREMRADPWR